MLSAAVRESFDLTSGMAVGVAVGAACTPFGSALLLTASGPKAAQSLSASGWINATRSPSNRHGTVTNVMSGKVILRIDITNDINRAAESSPGSTVNDLVAASASGSSVPGDSPLLRIVSIKLATKAC